MGTYAEYLQKSNELFRVIDGKFSIPREMILSLKEEFKNLLNEVAFHDGYPDGTSQDMWDTMSIDNIVIEKCSFKDSDANKIYKYYFDNYHVKIKEETDQHYIGALVSFKSRHRVEIISRNRESLSAISLMNELFYKTPPVSMMSVDPNGQPVRLNGTPNRTRSPFATGRTGASKSTEFDDLPTSSWDTLD